MRIDLDSPALSHDLRVESVFFLESPFWNSFVRGKFNVVPVAQKSALPRM